MDTNKPKDAAEALDVRTGSAWGILWRNGDHKYLVHEQCVPRLFSTRQFARNYISLKYGYIKTRADLRSPPHNWRMPVAVKVTVLPNAGDVARPGNNLKPKE